MSGTPEHPLAVRSPVRLLPDPRRVIVKPFIPGDTLFGNGQTRVKLVIDRVMNLPEEGVVATLDDTRRSFGERHRELDGYFTRHFDLVAGHIDGSQMSDERRLLIGAYFSQEYSIEATALNNPSLVVAPDQSGLGPDELRVIMSLRAIGEGHLSSIEFRSGVIDGGGVVRIDEPTGFAGTGQRFSAYLDKHLFTTRLHELGAANEIADSILSSMPDLFTEDEVQAAITEHDRQESDRALAYETARVMHWLASSNYQLRFDEDTDVSERVIFPAGPTESHGMEDARFVRFIDDDGSGRYFATYTAYDGFQVLPQLIETYDFVTFRMATLSGPRASNKGMALFPRMINGRYAALSRFDSQNNYVMFSDEVRYWDNAVILQMPRHPWELVQIGNCGSPIETEGGWLVITHGVGPMRQYVLSAILLDLDDPTRVLGYLPEPLLKASDDERDGYVPNVVYSCGSLIHSGRLILPYAYADEATRVATLDVDDLLDRFEL